ncbi:MAG: hypothetical protein Q9220_001685 [cf. Caloplaca sp. 1 TL-2023]
MEPTTPTGSPSVYDVGQHESKRQLPITPQVLLQALDCDYNMLTISITTPLFQSRVLALLSNHLADLKGGSTDETPLPTLPSLSATDTALSPGDTTRYLIGIVSPWIDLSSPDPLVCAISRQVLELEVSYAAFCGISNVIVPGPRLQYASVNGEGIAQYAYAVQEALALSNSMTQILIHLPIFYRSDPEPEDVQGNLSAFTRPEYVEEELKSKYDFLRSWDAWHIVRTVCNYNARLYVALSIPRHLPAFHAQSRWQSEPLRLLSLTAQTFMPNQKGFPALTEHHRALIHRYMRKYIAPWILLCDVGPIPGLNDPEAKISQANGFISAAEAADPAISPTPAEAANLQEQDQQNRTSGVSTGSESPLRHLSYIRNLQLQQPPLTRNEQYSSGYQDWLQGPLQPLSDNLESATYETFEKDQIKYDLYETAIRKALVDWVQGTKSRSSPTGQIVVAVVGAGRGPLVTRALQAAEDANVKIDLWAVEKNPNAFVLLERHNEITWSRQVNLVQSDMRTWSGPSSSMTFPTQNQAGQIPKSYKIDILVSELLGSFADNELSPECLNPLLPLLNPLHGISIPSSYTSYLTPIAAPKIHANILARTASGDASAANTPYVVMLHAIDYLSTQPPDPEAPPAHADPIVKRAWGFAHSPKTAQKTKGEDASAAAGRGTNKYNERYTRLTFPIPHRGCCHGLAGYFSAVLYADVELSTHPLEKEQRGCGEMMSWFPIYFPLKIPLSLPTASELVVSMRRVTDNRKVWYEWLVESFLLPTSNDTDIGAGGGTAFNRDSAGTQGTMVSDKQGKGKGREGKIRLGVSEVGSSREGGCVM